MEDITLTIDSKTGIYKNGITGLDLLKKTDLKNIICIKVNNKYKSLHYKIKEDSNIEFIDFLDTYGHRLYVNGLKFLLLIATKEVLGSSCELNFCHSIDKGIYIKSQDGTFITKEILEKIKFKMNELINKNLPFELVGVLKKDLMEYYERTNQPEKKQNLTILTGDYAGIIKCMKYYGYFYGPLPISTCYIKKFDLTFVKENVFVLQFPVPRGGIEVPPYTHREKIVKVIDDYEEWIKSLNTNNVGELNKIVSSGEIKQFILMNELNQNKKLIEIANKIKEGKDTKKLIMIAGPSSSGKTTTANKVSIYLKELGLNPHLLSTDDYFVEREETPLDENGEPDYESINTVDLNLFNNHLNKLLNGEEVNIPTFNFITGKKEYKNRLIKLNNNDILIVEGLHTLNEKLTENVPRDQKLKIYISPFTPLGIDTHNFISSTDLRLLRRCIRDYTTRGYDVISTLKSWQKVRKGEEIYVFPFQDEADIVFNTALIYEIGILKIYVEPLLYAVKDDSIYYEEARRLLRFLYNFLPIPSEYIPKDSILREFIGGSCFYE